MNPHKSHEICKTDWNHQWYDITHYTTTLDDASIPKSLLQQPVRWVDFVAQSEHRHILFGHLWKKYGQSGLKNPIWEPAVWTQPLCASKSGPSFTMSQYKQMERVYCHSSAHYIGFIYIFLIYITNVFFEWNRKKDVVIKKKKECVRAPLKREHSTVLPKQIENCNSRTNKLSANVRHAKPQQTSCSLDSCAVCRPRCNPGPVWRHELFSRWHFCRRWVSARATWS